MSTATAAQSTLKVGQFVLADIPECDDFAIGVIRGKKRGDSGFDVEILNPNDLEVNTRTIADDDLMPASADDIKYAFSAPLPFKVIERDDACFPQELPKHEQRQNWEMGVARAELPGRFHEEATVAEVVRGLVVARMITVATELLFGTRRGKFGNTLDKGLGLGLPIFNAFYSGKIPAELFCQVADNHRWTHPGDNMDGLPIDVYEGETLVISEPVATKLLNNLR